MAAGLKLANRAGSERSPLTPALSPFRGEGGKGAPPQIPSPARAGEGQGEGGVVRHAFWERLHGSAVGPAGVTEMGKRPKS